MKNQLTNIALEGTCNGVPVVTARRGGIPEVVQQGKTGWLFDPDRVDGFAAQFESIVQQRQQLQTMRQFCLRAGQAVTPESIAAQHVEIYQYLLR